MQIAGKWREKHEKPVHFMWELGETRNSSFRIWCHLAFYIYIARAAKSLVDTRQIFGQPAPIVVLNNICMDGVVTLKLVSKIGLTTDILFL